MKALTDFNEEEIRWMDFLLFHLYEKREDTESFFGIENSKFIELLEINNDSKVKKFETIIDFLKDNYFIKIEIIAQFIHYRILVRGNVTVERGGINLIYERQLTDKKLIEFNNGLLKTNSDLVKTNKNISRFTFIYATAAILTLVLQLIVYCKI